MARSSRRGGGKGSGRAQSGFHTPFAQLRDASKLRAECRESTGGGRDAEEVAAAGLDAVRTSAASDDEMAFAAAMEGVAPLDDRGRCVPTPRNPAPARPSPDEEALAELHAFVNGDGELEMYATDEYVEGIAPGVDRQLLKRLRRGEFAVEDVIDLHGMNRQEARTAVRDFLIRNRQLGRRVLRIITGRGLNSQDKIPVLRERLRVWLTRSGMQKYVLAFSSAPGYDGGTGAVYVLLKRR